jgi:branched-subunit amino acid aminotransferase/4-amino-4-deoxychorismate lyase
MTNLFVCLGDRHRTPAAPARVPPGIARARLLRGGHPVEAGGRGPEDRLAADEAFLTDAVRGAIPRPASEGVPPRRGIRWRAALAAILDGR